MEQRPKSFYVLAVFFSLFLIFLYGPTITIAILSFQGPSGGLTFPMKGSQPEDNSWGGQQENHGYSGRPNSQGWGSEGGRSSGNQGSHGGWGNSDSGNRNPGEDDDIPF